MAISRTQFEAIGARNYLPEGPFGTAGNTPLPNFQFGSVVGGDFEGEFTYLQFAPTTSVTLNQGDVLQWDHTYLAAPLITPSATGGLGGIGTSVGTFFMGGRIGDPGSYVATNSSLSGSGVSVALTANEGNLFSYTFAAGGVYGIWVQRAGTSLIQCGTITTQATASVSTGTAGKIQQATGSGKYLTVSPIMTVPQSITFTANTSTTSSQLTAVAAINGSALYGLEKGMVLTGTGIATGPAPVITDIQGNTITMSALGASGQTGTTVTASTQQFVAISGVNGAYTVTASALSNIYPNQILSGTNIGSSAVVQSITGGPGAYTLTLSVANSGTVSNATATATGYYMGYLRWPTVTAGA